MSQYCAEVGMMGPLTTAITSMDDDKFFISDNRKPFDTKKYQYIGTALPGFMFGLISIQDLPDSSEAHLIEDREANDPMYELALR